MGASKLVEQGASYSEREVYCETTKTMKVELQLIAAFVLSIGGLVLLFCGIFIDPQGQIHETLLVAFGETATFAGALFGIDYVYKKKK